MESNICYYFSDILLGRMVGTERLKGICAVGATKAAASLPHSKDGHSFPSDCRFRATI
jgi:hypothetical protein